MATAQRIGPEEAREHMDSSDALLVCAYEDARKFERNHLEGAISLQEFQSMADDLDRNREIIFYCA
jgi:rhodanese-related sulfurtransferase